MRVQAASTSGGGGKRISQNEFTEKAWQVRAWHLVALLRTPVRAWLCCPQAAHVSLRHWILQSCELHVPLGVQAITAAPDIAKQYSQQIVETEHLLKALLEQPNGLARKIVSKAEGNPTALLDATEAFIRRQPRVSGDSSQVCSATGLLPAISDDALAGHLDWVFSLCISGDTAASATHRSARADAQGMAF